MSFFNDKEEVINIELTQYGKKLLSQGKFLPSFYTFHDDDVLYDSKFGSSSIEEKQTYIEERILNETPRLKTNYIYSPVYLNKDENTEIVETKKLVIAPLGKSSYNSSYYPAFKFTSFISQIDSWKEEEIAYNENAMRINSFKIPQLTMKNNIYKLIAEKGKKTKGCLFKLKSGEYSISDLGTAYDVFEILEKNVDSLEDNFELEVYIEEEEEASQNALPKKFWRQLFFKEKLNNNISYKIENNILYDANEISLNDNNKKLLSLENYVETYLDIRFDDAAENRSAVIDRQCPDINKPVFKRNAINIESEAVEFCR